MKHYLKIENNTIIEAPEIMVKEDKTIYGYNKESNEPMLFEDGYEIYSYPASAYEIINGQITKKTEPEPSKREIFTKLEIRRAMRKLGIEDQLNALVSGYTPFATDWNDAQEINLNDEMIQGAISSGFISQELIDLLQENIKLE